MKFILALILLVASVMPGMAEEGDFLIGHWFGQGEPSDATEMWIAHLEKNGDFSAQFRTCLKGKATDLLQKGKWRFSDGVQYIKVTQSGGAIVYWEAPYKMLGHDSQHQTYQSPDGFVFRSARVGRNFRMPPCELVS